MWRYVLSDFYLVEIANYNPLAKILDENHLKSSNYFEWKRNLRIVLTIKKLVYVLDENTPDVLGNNDPEANHKDYRLWKVWFHGQMP